MIMIMNVFFVFFTLKVISRLDKSDLWNFQYEKKSMINMQD